MYAIYIPIIGRVIASLSKLEEIRCSVLQDQLNPGLNRYHRMRPGGSGCSALVCISSAFSSR